MLFFANVQWFQEAYTVHFLRLKLLYYDMQLTIISDFSTMWTVVNKFKNHRIGHFY